MLGKLLCYLNFHDWEYWYYNPSWCPVGRECKRCNKKVMNDNDKKFIRPETARKMLKVSDSTLKRWSVGRANAVAKRHDSGKLVP